MQLDLYHRWECPYSARVREFIAMHRLGPAIRLIEITENPEGGDELEELTGRRQVPCLAIDGAPMHESDKINQWLDDNFVQTEMRRIY